MVTLLGDARFVPLKEGKVLMVRPEEHAEWMHVAVA